MSGEMQIKEIPVQLLHLKPNDVVVVRVPVGYDTEQSYRAAEGLIEIARQVGFYVAIVGDDVSLAVVSKEELPK